MRTLIFCLFLFGGCATQPVNDVSEKPKNTFKEQQEKEKEITYKYIGMSEGAAILLAEIEGYRARVLIRDGKWASNLGEESAGNRINFNIKDGIVISAALD
jgi:hypothetical protein